MSVGRGAGLDGPPTTTRTRDAARITSGRPGPPVAPRPAGCPILTREAPIGAVGGSGPHAGRRRPLPWVRCATPRPPGSTSSRTCTDTASPTPTAGSRTPTTRAPQAWTRGPGRPRRRGARRACRCARRSPPGWSSWCTPAPSACRSGAGGRAFSTRRDPGQEHAVLRVREADGTVRVLVDPMALDPAGTTTLDAWSPSWEGDRLAYQLSTGGDEESRLYVLDVATGEVVDGPVDRCRYSPVAWLPGGEELFYVRRLAPDQVPAGEEQFHRRVWRHRVGAPAEHRRAGPRRGQRPDHLLRRAHQPRRPLAGRLRLGRHRARATTSGSPTCAGDGALRDFQVGVDAQTAAWVARDGRLWLMSDRDTPRWRLAVADPADPATWAPGGLAGRRPAAAGRRPVRRRARRRPGRRPAGARRARRRRHRPAVGLGRGRLRPARRRRGPRRRQHLRRQLAARRAAATAWVGYTDYATPPSVLRWDAGVTDRPRELGAGRRRRRRARR